MMRMRFRCVLLFLFLFALPYRAFSQSANFSSNSTDTFSSSADSGSNSSNSNSNSSSFNPVNSTATTRTFLRDIHELSFYTGQSFGYPLILSDLPGQRLTIVGARLTSHFIEFHHTALNYNFDLKPVAIYSNDIYGPRRYTYGGGGALGLQILPHNHWRYRPFFDVNGGLLAFTKQTPVPDSRRVNMTLDFGPGLCIPIDSRRSLKTGAQFFHFSNAWTARFNPGFDSFLVYVSYTIPNVKLW
jgi:lipid A 3-O-deacylase PagL